MATIEFTPEGHILGASPVFCQLTGYAESELIGWHHRMFCPEANHRSQNYTDFRLGLTQGKGQSDRFLRLRLVHNIGL